MKFDMMLPLLGFEDIKEVQLQKIDDIFMTMISSEDENVSFTMIDPFVLREYDFEITDSINDLLHITDASNLIILNITLIQTPIENSVVNFIAPLVFNTDNNKAAQIILYESEIYGVAEKISDFLTK